MTRTLVHLMRHGEVHNPDSILYGRLPDYHLSDLGRRMAETVARDLADTGADLVHLRASPLERAQESAAPVAAAFDLEVVTDPRVIEAGSDLQGQAISRHPALLLRPANLVKLYNPIRPSWGEPFQDQTDRMITAIKTARAAAEGHEALIVSHQSPIWSTRLFLEGRSYLHDPRRRQCTLASLTTLIFDGATLVGIGYREPAAPLLTQATTIT
ncbi:MULTISPECIES: histidine phosphatase family protein [unclassified Pseudactinotalea]|uniref:histidine phosphatase family protein n=1 Tax=unclassified Pseudactinotalea TaxID=2649176 RepID=UPI00128CBD45|nr:MULTISPECIES: histidine phosphatase family protein [unclassified Pseudactinotalea]MPV50478.1 histidine phosphatase family protein [Pseudactinotalea sp. HY160]QGH70499.1 histidine phosphatase family protein [Pseudactinotalea sp. HY158]